MAANSYYTSLEADTAYAGGRPGHSSHSSTSSIKPLKLAAQGQHGGEWHGEDHPGLMFDKKLKQRIRRLRIIQRFIAVLISIAALVPLAMTLHKFLSTRYDYRDIQSPTGTIINRNPWALKNKAWPTYFYFSTAVISTLVHLSVLFGYLVSVRTSNILDRVGTWVMGAELAGQFILWVVVAVIYKYQREKVEAGKHNDLWGWTCSVPAQSLQTAFKDVIDFKKLCGIQSAGWYVSLVQIGAIVLAILIMFLAWRRKKSKIALARARRSLPQGKEQGKERLRHQAV